MGMRAIRFGGTVYLGRLDGNKQLAGGIRKAGNIFPLEIQVAIEIAEQISAMKESFGQTLHSVASITGVTGSGNLKEYDADVMAWAFAGDKEEMTGTGGTVSAESVSLIEGEWVELANRGVSSVVIAGSVEGTDFEVNQTLGMVRMIPGGNLTAGANDVGYSYGAESNYRITIGTNTQNRFYTLLDGKNMETGADFYGVFDSVLWQPNTSVQLISDPTSTDFGDIPMDLTFETLTGKTTPGTINSIPLNLY